MAEEPDNLVLRHLRDIRADVKEMRGDVHEIRTVLDLHTFRFDYLDERVEMLREGTLTAIGFAASASEQNKKLAQQLADLTKRVEKREGAR